MNAGPAAHGPPRCGRRQRRRRQGLGVPAGAPRDCGRIRHRIAAHRRNTGMGAGNWHRRPRPRPPAPGHLASLARLIAPKRHEGLQCASEVHRYAPQPLQRGDVNGVRRSARCPRHAALQGRQDGLPAGQAVGLHEYAKPGGQVRKRVKSSFDQLPGWRQRHEGPRSVLIVFSSVDQFAQRASNGTSAWASGLPQPVTGSQPGAA